MPEAGSISMLLQGMKQGDEQALTALHHKCWPWMVRKAQMRLKNAPLRVTDEEDVAQAAFVGFVESVRAGRVPHLDSRHDFFALLTHIIACKAASQLQHSLGVEKRGAGKVRGESALDIGADSSFSAGIQAFASNERTPADEAELNDLYQHCMVKLPDALRQVAEMHIAGATNHQIAEALCCAERTVERKLAFARRRWQEIGGDLIGRP